MSIDMVRKRLAERCDRQPRVFQSLTGYSQEAEKYDRATDLEALGGRLIELQPREWKEIAEAA